MFGVWWSPGDPDSRFPGRLTWDPPRAPIVEALDPPPWMHVGFDEPIPILCGDVDRFGRVTLLDCRRAGLKFGLASTHSFRVAHALTRVHLTDVTDPFARRLELEVPALAALLGHHPVRIAGRPSTRSTTLRLAVEARHHRWLSDGVGVEFKYVWATHSTTLGVDVQMKPQVVLTSPTSRSFGWWFDEWLVPLSNFVHIASAVPFRPRTVRMWSKKRISRLERADAYVSLWGPGLDPDEPDRTNDLDPRHFRPVLIPDQLRDLNVHTVMQLARASRDVHEVYYGLLTAAMVATDRPLTHRYLDVITALEAFHSTVHGRGPLSDEKYKAKLAGSLQAVADGAARKFLKKWTPSTASFSLEQRLTHLHRQAGGEWTRDAATMAKLRNDIAHGGARPDHYLLTECFAQATDVARRLALHEMGIR